MRKEKTRGTLACGDRHWPVGIDLQALEDHRQMSPVKSTFVLSNVNLHRPHPN